MQTYGRMMMLVEPDTKNCTTEGIIGELSKCSLNNKYCKYGFYDGETSTFCIHPDYRKF